MKKTISTAMLALLFALPALATDREGDCDGRDGRDCKPKTKDVCFNLVCYYVDHKNPKGYRNCKASAVFDKAVTLDGGEFRDDSTSKNHPQFEVACDDLSPYHSNSALRFTSLLGTRIQAQTGPHPAISLPRGALHSGPDGFSGEHISRSVLEVDAGDEGLLKTDGVCFIWTGQP